MSVRDSFVQHFGEDQAAAIEAAAAYHNDGGNKGSDPFKWAVAFAIGYECFSVDRYREYHGITASADKVRQWIKDCGELASHDGDFDVISMLAGVYNEYVGVAAPTHAG